MQIFIHSHSHKNKHMGLSLTVCDFHSARISVAAQSSTNQCWVFPLSGKVSYSSRLDLLCTAQCHATKSWHIDRMLQNNSEPRLNLFSLETSHRVWNISANLTMSFNPAACSTNITFFICIKVTVMSAVNVRHSIGPVCTHTNTHPWAVCLSGFHRIPVIIIRTVATTARKLS